MGRLEGKNTESRKQNYRYLEWNGWIWNREWNSWIWIGRNEKSRFGVAEMKNRIWIGRNEAAGFGLAEMK